MEFYLLLITLCLLLIWHVYLHYSRRGRIVNRLPGPTRFPILGNALQVNVSPAELFRRLRSWSEMYYPVFRLWIGNVALVHIRHPDDFEIVLTSKNHINKKFAYEHTFAWLKTGLLTSSGEKWHHRRRILTPAFHFNILNKHMDILVEQAERTISSLKNECPRTDVDLLSLCMKYTLNVICESSMGVTISDGELGNKKIAKYKEALDDMVNMIVFRLLRPYIQEWALPLLPGVNKKIKNSVIETNRFINEIIQQRREYHEENLELFQNNMESFDDIYFDGKKKKRLAMLDLLLTAEREKLIDHEGIVEEVSTFVFAGHDTTGMALTFGIMILSEHEVIQNRARREVEEIINQKDGKLEFSDLKDMVYLEMCIKEILRLYPSVPSITRLMTEDLQLKHCLAPKGSDVVMHIVDVHRDPNFWPEPTKYDPERFLPDEVSKRHPFAFVPFSAGYRNCIGQRFAMSELKTFMALILYNFHLQPIDRSSDIKLISDIILRPDRPIKTRFIKIDR